MDNDVDIVLFPCGHLLCKECNLKYQIIPN